MISWKYFLFRNNQWYCECLLYVFKFDNSCGIGLGTYLACLFEGLVYEGRNFFEAGDDGTCFVDWWCIAEADACPTRFCNEGCPLDWADDCCTFCCWCNKVGFEVTWCTAVTEDCWRRLLFCEWFGCDEWCLCCVCCCKELVATDTACPPAPSTVLFVKFIKYYTNDYCGKNNVKLEVV